MNKILKYYYLDFIQISANKLYIMCIMLWFNLKSMKDFCGFKEK